MRAAKLLSDAMWRLSDRVVRRQRTGRGAACSAVAAAAGGAGVRRCTDHHFYDGGRRPSVAVHACSRAGHILMQPSRSH